MPAPYANEFKKIPRTIASNHILKDKMIALIGTAQMPGKATEGGDRATLFRDVLRQLTHGTLDLPTSYAHTEVVIPKESSLYATSNRVFASGWGERLVRTQFSRFYNQSVLQTLLSEGHSKCFVPHSSEEEPDSPCSKSLADKTHNTQLLLDRLIDAYELGNWDKTIPKIPHHPHCTHTITPTNP